MSSKTGLSEETIFSIYKDFIEDCPNGLMNRDKFIEIHEKLNPRGDPEKFCKLAFKAFDTDNSGEIDFNEFCVIIATNGSDLDLRKTLEFAFSIYDSDNDQKICKKEMKKAIKAILELKGIVNYGDLQVNDMVDEIFSKYDKNNDKLINLNEFFDILLDSHSRDLLFYAAFQKC